MGLITFIRFPHLLRWVKPEKSGEYILMRVPKPVPDRMRGGQRDRLGDQIGKVAARVDVAA